MLDDAVADRCVALLHELVPALGVSVIELVVRPDHVHLFSHFPPTLAPYQIMHRLKGATAHALRQEFAALRSRLPSLWTHSYYGGTAGTVSSETIRTYIEAQQGAKVRRSFRYRLYPTRVQTDALSALLESHRALYNAALTHRRWSWERGVSITYDDQSAELKDIRREDDGLAACNFSSCQATLRRLDRSFRAFFRRVKAGQAPGYPRYKGHDRFNTVDFPAHGDGCRFFGPCVKFQGVGSVKVKYHRSTDGTIKTVSFTREADRWFVIVSCDLGDAPPLVTNKPAVGIDLGLRAFLVTSDGETVAPPRFAQRNQAKLRRTQRALSRCRRGSKRRQTVKLRVARGHAKVANQRRDFHHKTAKTLTDRYGTVCVEVLNVRGIARSRLAKSAHDAGWGQFVAILGHKAEGAGVRVIAVDPRNTTQACSDCGCVPAVPLGLSDRVYHCASCGYVGDRDLNAARNVLWRGHRRQELTAPLGAVS